MLSNLDREVYYQVHVTCKTFPIILRLGKLFEHFNRLYLNIITQRIRDERNMTGTSLTVYAM